MGVSAFWHGGDAWDVEGLRAAVAEVRRRIAGRRRRRAAMRVASRPGHVDETQPVGMGMDACAAGGDDVDGALHIAADHAAHAPPNLDGIDSVNRSLQAATRLFTPESGLFTPESGLFTPGPGIFTPAPGIFTPGPGLFTPDGASIGDEPLLFSIVGAVDGITDEVVPLHPHDPNSDEWEFYSHRGLVWEAARVRCSERVAAVLYSHRDLFWYALHALRPVAMYSLVGLRSCCVSRSGTV
eukprot:scaffold932_cov97-Isochrysis_galbana.AAC.9